ncbi:MAG TPA: isochorismatase family protein [Pseudonocardia sp.]|jgi:nicotinamidase-related amidase|nr:isochorismatase family protein [Pseudonocardia sp.]
MNGSTSRRPGGRAEPAWLVVVDMQVIFARPGSPWRTPGFADAAAGISRLLPAFGELVLTGVSTDCCVLSTALGAADAGVHARVVSDACAGLSATDHRRALDTMALYQPFLEVVTVADVLGSDVLGSDVPGGNR